MKITIGREDDLGKIFSISSAQIIPGIVAFGVAVEKVSQSFVDLGQAVGMLTARFHLTKSQVDQYRWSGRELMDSLRRPRRIIKPEPDYPFPQGRGRGIRRRI